LDRPPRFVRQFALTRGRVSSAADLALDTLVQATDAGWRDLARLVPQQRSIIELARTPISVAEISAHLGLHLGIARVLVSDLAVSDHLAVSSQVIDDDGPDLSTLERLLDDLQAF
jgi:hypothetical protein